MRHLLLFVLLLFQLNIFAQQSQKSIPSPQIFDFETELLVLASDSMQGREIGTNGGLIAANYMAMMMHQIGLQPFHCNTTEKAENKNDYFQTFKLIKYTTPEASITIKTKEKKSNLIQLNLEKDFVVNNAIQSLKAETELVFAGYGIHYQELGYNDYATIDAKGKVAIILEGYPGQKDTLSAVWQQFKTLAENDGFDKEAKLKEAAKQGVIAVILIKNSYNNTTDTPSYHDGTYVLLSDTLKATVPCIQLSEEASQKITVLLLKDLEKVEQDIANQSKAASFPIKNNCKIVISTHIDTLSVHNVIGLIPGIDTTKTIIIGAHYDHLGTRNNLIYNGADDNASGASGLLALAKKWNDSTSQPDYNLLFASWTAEEKGLLGSAYFASQPECLSQEILLYINMDMISRSESKDTAQRMLSIGTRTSDTYLRETAEKCNTLLAKPFELDLWDVTGHTGSDYASFTAKNIAVMTYNSGLHDDYHTIRDVAALTDFEKMQAVLDLINQSIQLIFNDRKEK